MKKLSMLLLILILALAACGGDGDDEGDDADTTDEQNTEQTEEEQLPEDEESEDEDATPEVELPADEEEPADDEEATDEEATEEAATDDEAATDEEATEETSDDDTGGEPVTVTGFQSFEGDCPSRFDIQYPPNWTLESATGGNPRFTVDVEGGGETTARFEYVGSFAQAQVETTYNRIADLETTEQVGEIQVEGESFPIYRDDRTSPIVRYYQFMLPGNLLVDNLRLVVNPTDGDTYPDEESILQMLSTVVSNTCN